MFCIQKLNFSFGWKLKLHIVAELDVLKNICWACFSDYKAWHISVQIFLGNNYKTWNEIWTASDIIFKSNVCLSRKKHVRLTWHLKTKIAHVILFCWIRSHAQSTFELNLFNPSNDLLHKIPTRIRTAKYGVMCNMFQISKHKFDHTSNHYR